MWASISASHGSHSFINSKGRDNPPTHNNNSQLHRTYIHPPLHYLLTTNRPAQAHHFLLARPLPCSKPNQIYIPCTILPLTYFIHLPMKMEPTVSSETSAVRTQAPGNYPKRNKLYLEHGESLKTKKSIDVCDP